MTEQVSLAWCRCIFF